MIELIMPLPKHVKSGGSIGYPHAGWPDERKVVAIGDGIREREHGEMIHLRSQQGEPCQCCGRVDGVWTDHGYFHGHHDESCAKLSG